MNEEKFPRVVAGGERGDRFRIVERSRNSYAVESASRLDAMGQQQWNWTTEGERADDDENDTFAQWAIKKLVREIDRAERAEVMLAQEALTHRGPDEAAPHE